MTGKIASISMKTKGRMLLKATITRRTYVLLPGRIHLKYRDIAHHPGGIIWWIDAKNRFKRIVSTGVEFHHDLYRWADWHWRGRVDPIQQVGTMMPPLSLYTVTPEKIPVPGWIVVRLKKLGAAIIYVDTVTGMRTVAMRRHVARPALTCRETTGVSPDT